MHIISYTLQEPESGVPYSIDEEAFAVVIILVRIDSVSPSEVQLEIKACLEAVSETTTMAQTTTLGPVTGATGVVTFTEPESTTAVSTTEEPCDKLDGMADPMLIPSDWIAPSSGSTDALRPGSVEKWTSDADDEELSITLNFVEGPQAVISIESLALTDVENIDSIIIATYTSDSVLTAEPTNVEVCG